MFNHGDRMTSDFLLSAVSIRPILACTVEKGESVFPRGVLLEPFSNQL